MSLIIGVPIADDEIKYLAVEPLNITVEYSIKIH